MASRPSAECGRIRELAEQQRRSLGHPYLGEEHLLLGILAHGRSTAAEVLTAHGLRLDTARAAVDRIAARHGPLAKDDATVLAEFGVDVEAMRRRLESTFGTVAVHEAVRAVRRRRWWRGGAAGSALCGPVSLIKRAQMLACTRAGRAGRGQIEPEDLLYGVLRCARDSVGTGLGRRGRRDMIRLGLPVGGPHPVRLLLDAHTIDLEHLLAHATSDRAQSGGLP